MISFWANACTAAKDSAAAGGELPGPFRLRLGAALGEPLSPRLFPLKCKTSDKAASHRERGTGRPFHAGKQLGKRRIGLRHPRRFQPLAAICIVPGDEPASPGIFSPQLWTCFGKALPGP